MFTFWVCFYRLDTSYCPIYPQMTMRPNLTLFRSNTGLIFRLTMTSECSDLMEAGNIL